MKEEQERPKIKLKVRQIEDENLQTSSAELQPVQKITIHEKTEEKSQKNEKLSEKKRSVFQIVAIVLTVLLVIAVVVEIAVMLWLKSATNDLNDKNSKLPPASATFLINQVDDFDNDFLIDKI